MWKLTDLLRRRMCVCFLRWEFAAFEDKLLRNAVWQGGQGRDSKLCLCVCPRAGKQICILGKKTLMSYSNIPGAWYANEVGCRHSESHKTLQPRGTCVRTAAYKQREESVYISAVMACMLLCYCASSMVNDTLVNLVYGALASTGSQTSLPGEHFM